MPRSFDTDRLEREVAQVTAAPALTPAFARAWASAVRTFRKHVAALAAGDRDAFDRAVKARNKLTTLANSGEVPQEAAEQLYEAIAGRGPHALPRIGEAQEAGRQARLASYDAQRAELRQAERAAQSPHSYAGELRMLRGR